MINIVQIVGLHGHFSTRTKPLFQTPSFRQQSIILLTFHAWKSLRERSWSNPNEG